MVDSILAGMKTLRFAYRSATQALGGAALAVLCVSPDVARSGPIEDGLRSEIAGLSQGQAPDLGGMRVSAAEFIAELYEVRGYAPIWQDERRRDDLSDELADSIRHGFVPKDFDVDLLSQLQEDASDGNPAAIVRFDIAATEAAARLLQHIYFGKVDPNSLNADWGFERPFTPGNPAKLVDQYLTAASLGDLIDDIEIAAPAYTAMQDALETHMAISLSGGWPQVPQGDVLKPGATDPRIPTLRRRLSVTGDFTEAAGDGDTYDPALEDAVKGFQSRHGLEADGVVGAKTYRALNRTVEERIDQLRVSLERARWTLRDLGQDFVFVNIGGAETVLVQNGEVTWRTRSIVGQAYRKTPVFQDQIRYMEFNPTWTVPRSILRNDKLAKIRQDAGYLSRGNYLVKNADGRTINPSSVNWFADNPPVTLVQQPGPDNALGLVKFMFPNEHAVYLHDTNDRSLFDRAERNLSSGCVRIENPFEFADLLLAGDAEWSADRRNAILASGKTTRVDLPEPLPVLLTYYTAWVGFDGSVQFREDIYERDGAILAALRAQIGD